MMITITTTTTATTTMREDALKNDEFAIWIFELGVVHLVWFGMGGLHTPELSGRV